MPGYISSVLRNICFAVCRWPERKYGRFITQLAQMSLWTLEIIELTADVYYIVFVFKYEVRVVPAVLFLSSILQDGYSAQSALVFVVAFLSSISRRRIFLRCWHGNRNIAAVLFVSVGNGLSAGSLQDVCSLQGRKRRYTVQAHPSFSWGFLLRILHLSLNLICGIKTKIVSRWSLPWPPSHTTKNVLQSKYFEARMNSDDVGFRESSRSDSLVFS